MADHLHVPAVGVVIEPCAVLHAQAVVLDKVFFNLDADKFRQFTAMLDAPPAPNPGLERLMVVKAPWSDEAA